MNTRMATLALSMAMGSSLLFGCENSQQIQSPADQATAAQRVRCTADFSDATIARVLDGSAIERVAPLYNGSASKTSNPRLQGAAIEIEPSKGETTERLARTLECHQAQQPMVQATASTVRPDPFWLPDSSVQIEVMSARDGFLIEVTSDSTTVAQEILARAKALGAQQGTAQGQTADAR
jgi:hypothetical protein